MKVSAEVDIKVNPKDIFKDYDEFIAAMKRFSAISKNYKEEIDDIWFKKIQPLYPAVFEKAVNDWYGEYGPKIYSRRYDLMDLKYKVKDMHVGLLEIDIDKAIDSGDFIVPSHKHSSQSKGMMYTMIYEEGYHGGHPNGGWRYRAPRFVWSHWGRPAVKGTPLKTMYQQAQQEIIGPIYQQIIDEVGNAVFDKYLKESGVSAFM